MKKIKGILKALIFLFIPIYTYGFEGGWQCIDNQSTTIFLSVNVKQESDIFPYSVVILLFPDRHWEFSPVNISNDRFFGKTYTYDPYKASKSTEWGYISCLKIAENTMECEIVGLNFPRKNYTCYRLIMH